MSRYIPNTERERKKMLIEIGCDSEDTLFKNIPEGIRLDRDLNLPGPFTEMELYHYMKKIAEKNITAEKYICFLGAGAYDHYIPSSVNHILGRSEFYTSYTPYQPEISQGTLQAIFEYQTMICELTGMDVANASVYDGATAVAEAANMSCKITRKEEVIVMRTVNPQYRKTLKTYARFKNYEVFEADYQEGTTNLSDLEGLISNKTAAIIVQNPNFFGSLEEIERMTEIKAKYNALLIICVDPISLGLFKSPEKLGADIVVGEGQALGNPLSFGGPYIGFFAAKDKYLRQMPGRIVGQTVDKNGNIGFVLTMQTREQHIRREKASSNICSNQALNALAATAYLTLMGKQGLREVAYQSLQKAHYGYNKLIGTNCFSPGFTKPFFKEFTVRSEIPIDRLNHNLLREGIIGGYDLETDYPELKGFWLVAVTEKRTKGEIDKLAEKVAKTI